MESKYSKKIQSRYLREGPDVLLGAGRGGKRYSNLTQQEEEIISSFLDKARAGRVLAVSEVKAVYEEKAGKKAPKSTIYRMLAKHGRCKIAPRSRHPKADLTMQEEFKKTSFDCQGWTAYRGEDSICKRPQ